MYYIRLVTPREEESYIEVSFSTEEETIWARFKELSSKDLTIWLEANGYYE